MFRQGPFVRKIISSSVVLRKIPCRSVQMESNRERTESLSLRYLRTTANTKFESSLGSVPSITPAPTFSLPQSQPYPSFGNYSMGLPLFAPNSPDALSCNLDNILPDSIESTIFTSPSNTVSYMSTYKQIAGEKLDGASGPRARGYLLSISSNEKLDIKKVFQTEPIQQQQQQQSQQQPLFDWAFSSLNQEQAPYFVLRKVVMDVAKRIGREPTPHILEILLRSACTEALQPSSPSLDQTQNSQTKSKQLGHIHLALNDCLSGNYTPTLESFKAILSVFSQLNYVAAIAQLDSIMLKYSVALDDASFSVILNTLCSTHQTQQIDELFEKHLAQGSEPGLHTFNRIIKHYGRLGDFPKMLDYLYMMVQRQIPADQETLFNICLSYSLSDRIEDMTLTLLLMKEACGIVPDSATLRLLFTSLIQTRSREEFETLFTRLLALTQQPPLTSTTSPTASLPPSPSLSSSLSFPSVSATTPDTPTSSTRDSIFSSPSSPPSSSTAFLSITLPTVSTSSVYAMSLEELTLDQLVSTTVQDIWSNALTFELLSRPENQQAQPSLSVFRRFLDLLVASQPLDENDTVMFSEALVGLFQAFKRCCGWIAPLLLENGVNKLVAVVKRKTQSAESGISAMGLERIEDRLGILREMLKEEKASETAMLTSKRSKKSTKTSKRRMNDDSQ